MVAITGTIQELTAEGVTAESGSITIRLAVPTIDDPITSTAPFTVNSVDGAFSFVLPESPAGSGYKFRFSGIPGLGTFYFAVPSSAVTLSELIESHQVDSTSFDAVASAPTILEALALKAPIASPTFTGTVAGVTKSMVGLGSVDNTADTAKPVSTVQQTALDLKAPLASPTFTGTVSGVTKTMVGLGNVDNTTDVGKPVSTLQAAADTLVAAKRKLIGSARIRGMASGSTFAAPTMTSAPTVTQGTTVASGLTATLLPTSARLRCAGPWETSFIGSAYTPRLNTIGDGVNTGVVYATGKHAQIAFDFTGRYLDLDYRYYTTTKYRIWVNEQAATADFATPPAATTNTRQYLHFDFGADSHSTPRRIVIELDDVSSNLSVYGLAYAPTETVSFPSIPSPRVLLVGDSFAKGEAFSGGSNAYDSYAIQLGRLLGYADFWHYTQSVGSSGFITKNNPSGNFPQRFTYDVQPYSPDILIVQASVNDYPETSAAVVAAMRAYVATARAAFPNVEIVLLGPLLVGTATGQHNPIVAINTDLAAAALADGLPFVDTIGASLFTGTGSTSGAGAMPGPADWMRRGDFTHPTPAGANALAAFLAGQIERALNLPM